MSTPPLPLRKAEVFGAEELPSEGLAPGRPVSTRRDLTVVRPGRQTGTSSASCRAHVTRP